MDILYGHFEVHADYQLTPGNPDAGWRLSVSYNLNDNFNDRTQIVRLDPETTTFIASPRTGTTSGGAPLTITSAVSRLGPVGSPLWLFPQNNILGLSSVLVRSWTPAFSRCFSMATTALPPRAAFPSGWSA
jgi:hypothetical protein